MAPPSSLTRLTLQQLREIELVACIPPGSCIRLIANLLPRALASHADFTNRNGRHARVTSPAVHRPKERATVAPWRMPGKHSRLLNSRSIRSRVHCAGRLPSHPNACTRSLLARGQPTARGELLAELLQAGLTMVAVWA